jgi:plasmid stabilization system protein ParE
LKLNDIRWTSNALQDLAKIRKYVLENADQETMLSEARRIWQSCQKLKQFPEIGRSGRALMTREVIASPYVIPYRIKGNTVVILNVFHSAQKR